MTRGALGAAAWSRVVHGGVVCALLACACTPRAGGSGRPDGGAAVLATPAAAGALQAAGDAGPRTLGGHVGVSRVALKQAASEKARSAAVLNFGEALTILSEKDGWTAVRTSDGTEGFVAADALAAQATGLATLVLEQDLYARPDALSPVKKRLKRGGLMLVLADRNGWRQVRLPDRTEGWMPRDRALLDETELAHARGMWRAEQALADKLPEVALGALQDALAAQPTARLAPMTQQRLAPLLPADAGVPDAAVAVPSGVADASVMAAAPAVAVTGRADGSAADKADAATAPKDGG